MVVFYLAYSIVFLQTFATLALAMTADGHTPRCGMVLALNGVIIVVVQPLAVSLLAGAECTMVLAIRCSWVGAGVDLGAIVHSTAGYAGSLLIWPLGKIGIAAMSALPPPTSPPADLRGR